MRHENDFDTAPRGLDKRLFEGPAASGPQVSPPRVEAGSTRRFLRLLNLEILIQLVLLALIFAWLLYSLVTGNYREWIHPRYAKFLWLSLPLLAGGFVMQAQRLTEARPHPRLAGYAWFLLPIMAIFLLQRPIYGTDIQLERYNESGLNGQFYGAATGGGGGAAIGSDPAEKLPHVSGSIPIDAAHYASWLAQVIREPKQFAGKTFTFLARIAENPANPNGDDFLPGRPVMFCCAADAQPLGLLAKKLDNVDSRLGEWVYVTGKVVLEKGGNAQYPNELGPKLQILKLESAQSPKNIYAYYYGEMKLDLTPMK